MKKTSQKADKNSLNQISSGTNLVFIVIFILLIIVCFAPLILVLMISLTDEKTIFLNGYSFFPEKLSLNAYRYIISTGAEIWQAYGISIFTTVFGTFFSLAIICLYAYPLSRKSFRYKSQFSFFAYFTMIFSGGLVPWYIVYTQLIPIKDTVWALIIPYLMNCWYMMIMRTFFSTTIDESILEAAKMDGASELRSFLVIVVPLSRAGLATIALFCTLHYWNDWYLPLMFILNNKLYNIQYLMYQTLVSMQFLLNGGTQFVEVSKTITDLPSEGARMAIAIISIGPIILAYPFFQRYFVKGLTIGSVKG